MLKLKIINKPKMIKMKCNIEFPDVILANLQEKEVVPTKEKQEIVPDHQYDGLSKVTVNPIPDEYIVPSGEIEFTQNGTYDVTDKASAKVNVPEKTLGTKTITENGTYKAIDDGVDGYSEVEVATSGVDINEYLSDTITSGSSSLGGWTKTIKKMRSPLTIEGTSAEYMFYNYKLNELPQLDTSNVTDMNHMFTLCTNLTIIPQLDTSNVTRMDYIFSGCANLTTIPQINTSNVTDMRYMFYGCTNLTTTSQLDTSNVTDMNHMFSDCTNLTTIPQINTSNVTNMSLMFSSCTNLTTIPQLDTSNATNMSSMFNNCRKITTIPQLNGEKLINVYRNFYNCTSLENFNGLINLGQAFSTSQNANYYNYTLYLSDSKSLTEQSIINILNNLYDIATKGCKTQTVTLGATNLAKLTSTEGQQALSNAQAKGWNIN